MDVSESRSHSFVLKVGAKAGDTWYGYISHVDGGKRHYFRRLSEIPLFVAPYLQDLGVDLGPGWYFWSWVVDLGRKRA